VTGVAASRSWVDQQLSLSPGGRAEFTDRYGGRWRFVSQGVSRDEQVNYLSTSVALEVWRGEERRGFVSAERRQYLDSVQRPTFEPVLRPGLLSSPTIDVYALFRGLTQDGAALEISFRPLVGMVWVGWMLVGGAGLALALGPRPTKRSREPTEAG
jgi:cytochrome c biogenesis factor